MSTPRQTFFQLDNDSDVYPSSDPVHSSDDEETVAPAETTSDLTVSTGIDASGDTTLVNPDMSLKGDTDNESSDDGSDDEPPDIAMTQQAASPMHNSVFRQLITAGRQKADGPSESPSHGDSDGEEDLAGNTHNTRFELESQDDQFGRSPTPDAVSTPKRKHSPENDSDEGYSMEVDQRLAYFTRLPTAKKIKYSESFLRSISQPQMEAGTSGLSKPEDDGCGSPAAVTHQPIGQDESEEPALVRESSCLADSSGSPVLVRGGNQEGSPLVFLSQMSATLPSIGEGERQLSPIKLSQSQPMPVRPPTPPSRPRRFSPPPRRPRRSSSPTPPPPPPPSPPPVSTLVPSTHAQKEAARVYLSNLGLTYQETLKGVVCGCGIWLASNNIQGHLRKAHYRPKADGEFIQDALQVLGAASGTPRIPLDQDFIPGLILYSCYQCGVEGCPVVMKSEASMKVHSSMCHKIPKDKRVPWERCPAQRLNRSDRKSFFRVNLPEREQRPTVNSSVREILQEMNRRRSQVTSRLADSDNRHTTPWLITNKWPAIIGDRTPQSVRALVDNGGDIKHLSADLWAAMMKCSSFIRSTPELVLQRLNTGDPARGWNNTPFHHHQNHEATMKNYVAPALRMLALLLRTIDEQDEELRDLLNEYNATSAQIQDGESREAATHALCCILFYCFSREWLPTEDNLHPDPAMRSLAYSKVMLGGGYADAKDTTGDLAKMSYIIRLIMLWAMHNMVSITLSQACDRLSTWFTERRESTFNSVQSLQHYASSTAHGTVLPPMLFWLDPETERRMAYQGDVIELDEIVTMFATLGEDLVSLWEKEVSLGLHSQLVIKPMTNVADDLSNKSVGYSFLTDERNTYHREKATVLSLVISESRLTERFSNGFDYLTGRPMWNPLAIRLYLKHVQTFSRLLLARIEMTSGAPIRGTELTAMTFQNTSTRRRNLVMFGRFLVLLGLYSKTSSLTQSDRLIAHGVDALTAGLLIHFLTFVRPFVQVLVTECFSQEAFPGLHDMYDNFLFVDYDKLFTTERLSSIMEEYTDRFLSVPLSISHWRHVSIGFQKAHCRRELRAVTDVAEGDRAAAEQAGHSLALENRMYALSADGIEGTPGREMHLFCNVSVAYQTATRVVPSGIQLPYRECMPKEFQRLVDRGLIVLPRDRNTAPEEVIANKVFELLQPYIGKLLDTRQGKSHTPLELQDVPIPPSPVPADKLPNEDEDELEYVDNPALSVPVETPNQEEQDDIDNPPWSDVLDDFDYTVGPALITPSVKGKGKELGWSTYIDTDEMPPVVESNDTEDTPPSEWAGRHMPSPGGSHTWSGIQDPDLRQSVKVNMISKYDTSGALVVLRQLLHNVEAQWTSSVQSWGIAHVMDAKHDVLVVGPTGCGKTFIALIPAILERSMNKITVIVVPLISLLDDYQRRLKDFGMPYHVYSPMHTPVEGLPPNVRIILTTINRVATITFQRTMKTIHLKTPIARIVADEAHYALTAGFRPEYDNVETVRFMEVPLVLMSATVPPHLEKTLVDMYQLTDPHVLVRGSTERAEVRYEVLQASKTEEDLCNRAVNIVMDTLATLRPRDRILVFVSTKKIGDMLALALFCEFYYAGDKSTGEPGLTPEDRSLILESWHRGDRQVLVSTNALGAGNDYPSTRLVLHVGTPSGMIDFIQESGRAGRDHLPAKSTVIPFKSIHWMLRKDPEDLSGIKAMMAYVDGRHCRRFMLNTFNDGEDRSCKDVPNAQLCDYCSMVMRSIFPPHKKPDAPYPYPLDHPSSASSSSSSSSSSKPSSSRLPASSDSGFPTVSNLAPSAGPSVTSSEAPTQSFSDIYRRVQKTTRRPSTVPWVSLLKDALDVLERCCMFCTTTTHSTPYHGLNGCPQMTKKPDDSRFTTTKEHYMTTWRMNLIYAPRKFGQKPVCFKCHLPNGPGDCFHPAFGRDTVCPHPDLISAVGYRVLTTEPVFQEARAHFGQAWSSVPEYISWVTQPGVDYPSNLLAVFVWFFGRHF